MYRCTVATEGGMAYATGNNYQKHTKSYERKRLLPSDAQFLKLDKKITIKYISIVYPCGLYEPH